MVHNEIIAKNIPKELISIIFKYFPNDTLVNLNKKYYTAYNKYRRSFIPKNLFNSYTRDMIRNKNTFIFNYILNDNADQWKNEKKKYKWKNKTYDNYYTFLIYYSLQVDSNKIYNHLKNKLRNK